MLTKKILPSPLDVVTKHSPLKEIVSNKNSMPTERPAREKSVGALFENCDGLHFTNCVFDF